MERYWKFYLMMQCPGPWKLPLPALFYINVLEIFMQIVQTSVKFSVYWASSINNVVSKCKTVLWIYTNVHISVRLPFRSIVLYNDK